MELIWLKGEVPISVERDADPLLVAPGDATGDAHAVCVEDQAEAIGDAYGACYVERRFPDRHVSDDTVDSIAADLDCSGHQHTIPVGCTPFHGFSIHQFPEQSVNANWSVFGSRQLSCGYCPPLRAGPVGVVFSWWNARFQWRVFKRQWGVVRMTFRASDTAIGQRHRAIRQLL
jgi:hypothetical protein